MTRINTLAATILVLAGLNVGLAVVFGNNVAADVLNATFMHAAGVIVGIAALVAVADRFGWTREA
jgi:uncharacterized membrane protein YuzA (DUF378 family)